MTTMTDTGTWTVGQVADTFGVTVRTLHHYDEIGLLVPSERSRAGYRLYTAADVERLGRIVVWRRLELPLEQIAAVLDEGTDPSEQLHRQRAAVLTRLDELHELVGAIDAALERHMTDRPATTEELKEMFGDGYGEEYAAEAQARWGESEAWKQSQARTSRYTKADWAAVKAEQLAVGQAFVAALQAGEPPTSEAATAAAEAHRRSIERFYDCSYAMQRGLADMYIADPRFTKTYEDMAPGLAAYVRDAIHANADRHDC
jgi:DNA-binding transcriptional MerR regulator